MKNLGTRVSLAELQSQVFSNRTSADIDEGAAPTQRDLAEILSFSPGDGRIWMNDQRMVLWRSSTYGSLRSELISSIGQEQARSLLTRVGYTAGARDAELVRRMWPDSDPANAFHAGPRLHKLEGVVRPVTIAFEFDIAKGDFFADFWWHDSSEDDEHVAAFGIGTESACWMQVGYASGYASAFMGKLIIYRETQCRSMGAEVCRITGKPADQWDDPELDLRYFDTDAAARRFHHGTRVSVPDIAALQVSESVLRMSQTSELVGISSSFSAARHLIERVAPTQATVLFQGASGVGKELFAQTLHKISPRADQPFIALNCAAIPDTLVESELFGVERGAYTGANASRSGRFERAHKGTLFLDEIGSLSYVAQGKLLRALQERAIERVGGSKLIHVDVRVVAATNVDLRNEVAAGRFREDLLFRLNVFPIHIPPLKDRRDDIPLLMEIFLRRYCTLHGREVPGYTARAVRTLLQYDFPGNIRELQNLVERGVIMVNQGEAIDVHHLFRSGEISVVESLGVSEKGQLFAAASVDADESSGPSDARRGNAKSEPNSRDPNAQKYRKALIAARYNIAEAARSLSLRKLCISQPVCSYAR